MVFKEDKTLAVKLTEVKTEGAKLGRFQEVTVVIVKDDGMLLTLPASHTTYVRCPLKNHTCAVFRAIPIHTLL